MVSSRANCGGNMQRELLQTWLSPWKICEVSFFRLHSKQIRFCGSSLERTVSISCIPYRGGRQSPFLKCFFDGESESLEVVATKNQLWNLGFGKRGVPMLTCWNDILGMTWQLLYQFSRRYYGSVWFTYTLILYRNSHEFVWHMGGAIGAFSM